MALELPQQLLGKFMNDWDLFFQAKAMLVIKIS